MSKTQGNCFENAVEKLLSLGTRAVLVHGLVVHPEQGFRHVHAWCEKDGFVYDRNPFTGKPIVMPKDKYYLLGGIVEGDCRVYRSVQAFAYMNETKHYGPWDERLNLMDEASR